jgi:hypothetical protein
VDPVTTMRPFSSMPTQLTFASWPSAVKMTRPSLSNEASILPVGNTRTTVM